LVSDDESASNLLGEIVDSAQITRSKWQQIAAKRKITQKAAEELVASELSKRGYEVAYLGAYHPIADFAVMAPSGERFVVNAKGHAKPSDWAYGDKPDHDKLYYILVELTPTPSCFYILTQSQSKALCAKYLIEHPRNRNIHRGGFSRKDPHPFKDAWDVLPQ
jgi:hypothetical protein